MADTRRPTWFEWCLLCVEGDHLCLDCGCGVVHGVAYCGRCDPEDSRG